MDFHNVSKRGMEYLHIKTRDVLINREDLRDLNQTIYAEIKQEYFSLKYEHIILEDQIAELALLIACTKLVEGGAHFLLTDCHLCLGMFRGP